MIFTFIVFYCKYEAYFYIRLDLGIIFDVYLLQIVLVTDSLQALMLHDNDKWQVVTIRRVVLTLLYYAINSNAFDFILEYVIPILLDYRNWPQPIPIR